MNRLMRNIVLFLFVILISENVWALSIISPQEGLEVYAGARLQVIVKPDTGEEWEKVLLEIFPMSYDVLTNQYKEDIEIPSDLDATGYITFHVLALDKSGKVVKLERKLFAKLPLNVALQSIKVEPNFVVLQVFPQGGNPDDISNYGTRNIHVFGIYSDGINREFTPPADGITFTSSNEKVATVDSTGKVTAQGTGETKIIVKYKGYTDQTSVIVKPF